MKPYYSEAGITIYHGDARDILPTLEPVDLVLTDPPYAEQTHTGARSSKGGYISTMIDFPSVDAAFLRSMFADCKSKAWIVSFLDYNHAVDMERQPPEGYRGVRIGIWDKLNYTPQFTGDRPAQGWEAISILHKAGAKMQWNGNGRKSVWTMARADRVEHPTEKPLKLVRELARLFSNADALILDPFMGSGTTLRAAKDLGRKAIGIEIEEKYCEIAAKRMSQSVLDFGSKPVKSEQTQLIIK